MDGSTSPKAKSRRKLAREPSGGDEGDGASPAPSPSQSPSLSRQGTSVSQSFDTTGGGTQTGGNPLTSQGIWVAVRVRPFNKRELQECQEVAKAKGELGEAVPCVELERDRKTLTLLDPTNSYRERGQYHFDSCFSAFSVSVELESETKPEEESSDDEEEAAERAQLEIYRTIGQPMVASAWQGYNACIFAYGQTSSGKTYTMMGSKRDPGVIPRLCRELFERIEDDAETRRMQEEVAHSQPGSGSGGVLSLGGAATSGPVRKQVKVTVSYMEIYNEQVKDLLKARPKHGRPKFQSRFATSSADEGYESLRVRQHPTQGPFVEGLVKVDVNSWLDCVRVIRQGNDIRSTTETALNDTSSRSHAIFQLVVTQVESLGAKVRGKEVTNHRVSKVNLVDLAGSERITKSNVTGKHLTEANFINKSLSTLRKVIDVLVQNARRTAHGSSLIVVPYRESLLTWILSDNFGGNSKTAMIANVSPHFSCWLESEGTLRYATLAKGIVNRIRVNEDPSAKLIRELQTQLKALQAEMAVGPQGSRVRELEEQMEDNKHAMEELITREEGMRKILQESRVREATLRSQKETLEAANAQSQQEVERLRKEREELTRSLQKLVEEGGEKGEAAALLLQQTKDHGDKESEKDFWATQDETEKPDDIQASEDVACPPQPRVRPASSRPVVHETDLSPVQQHETKKPANPDQPAFLSDEEEEDTGSTPPVAEAKTNASFAAGERDSRGSSRPSSIPELKKTDKNVMREDSSITTPRDRDRLDTTRSDISISPTVRYGRRAVTEEGKEREKEVLASAQVRTAEQRPRRQRVPEQEGNGAQPSAVPLSLQHLVGPGSPPPPSSTSSSFARARGTASPDALDAFLSGSTEAPPSATDRRKDRGIPPWRQRK